MMEQLFVIANDKRKQTMFKVITWDEENQCTRYHEVADAIDFDDAESVIKGLYPDQKLLGTTFSTVSAEDVEKPVE